MTATRRPLARLSALGAAAVLAVTLTGCGGEESGESSSSSSGSEGSTSASGPPRDASTQEFCSAYNYQPDQINPGAGPEEQARAISKGIDEISSQFQKVGTPSDIPQEARDGFELSLKSLEELDEGEIRKALEKQQDPLADAFDQEERKKVEAFGTYAQEKCASPSGSGS